MGEKQCVEFPRCMVLLAGQYVLLLFHLSSFSLNVADDKLRNDTCVSTTWTLLLLIKMRFSFYISDLKVML